ncbi:MAG: molybdate transport system regulatory protein [Natrialbaceae archaeon]|jgi:molybdate transport system regulatory protein
MTADGDEDDPNDGDQGAGEETLAVDAGFDARLRVDDVSFEARDAALLEAIDEFGSLNRAADDLGRSYSRALERLEDLENAHGPLVERHRGGPAGGGSELTNTARDLLARFDRLRSGLSGVAETGETVLSGDVEDREGELGIVRTDAGPVRAIVPADGDRVQVAVRADAVTLNDPVEIPEPDATSARNRFEGVVKAVDRGTVIARVTVDVGAASPLAAVVTIDSVQRLDVRPGRCVVASFKATATRAVPDVDEDGGDTPSENGSNALEDSA